MVRTVAAARLHGQHQAARDGLAVQVDGAGAAVAGAAAFLGAGEAQVLAQGIEQRDVGLDEHLDGLAVDGAAQDLLGHGAVPPDQAFARCERGGERATGQDADQVPAELDGAALVADGPAPPRSPARPRARSASGVTGWPSSARSAAVARTGVGRDRGERDARLRAAAVGQRELGGDARRRRCRARAAACGAGTGRRCGRPAAGTTSSISSSFGASTVWRTPGEEVGHRHAPLALRPRDDRLGVQRHQRRRHVGRGRGVAEVAAHGGEVAHLHRADHGRALRERRDSAPRSAGLSSSSAR